MSTNSCIMIRDVRENGNRRVMAKRKAKKVVKIPLPPLAVFLQDELEKRKMTQLELEELSGIPDSTLSRIISGEVDEPKGSVVARLASGLGMRFWQLTAIMGITDDEPGSIEQESAQIAELLKSDPNLRTVMRRVMGYDPKNRASVLAYMRLLEEQGDPQAPQAEQ